MAVAPTGRLRMARGGSTRHAMPWRAFEKTDALRAVPKVRHRKEHYIGYDVPVMFLWRHLGGITETI